jgi:hypothetical protein
MAVPHDEVVISAFVQQGMKEHKRYRDEEWASAVLKRL